MNKTSLCFSVIALTLSLFAVYEVWSNPAKDHSANLIAALGIICTVLIGWQILSLVNLYQYEKRIESLESGLDESKQKTEDAYAGAFLSLQRSDGMTFHEFADIYGFLRRTSACPPEMCLPREIQWWLAEMENCLYTQDLCELSKATDNLFGSLKAYKEVPDSVRVEVCSTWKRYSDRFVKSISPKSRTLLDEIENINSRLLSI